MNPKVIANRIIKSMQDFPDKWKLLRQGQRLWAKHEAGIDVALEGGYWVDINDQNSLKSTGAPLALGWWQHRRVRAAAKALAREKMARILDRHELLGKVLGGDQ